MSVEPKNLLFLDESGANLQMAPLYGRAYKKERAYQAVPFNRGTRMTMIGVISCQKVEAAVYGEWSANGETFLEFIEKNVCPVLKKGQVLVMDNVAFHKVSGIREAIEKKGVRLVYLPPYSPELNPIELMWSKIKNCLRNAQARTCECFKKAIKHAFESIEQNDLIAWFNHSGYFAQ